MATYGPTSVGWVGKPLSVVQSELDADYRGILGDSAGTETDGTIPLQSLAGQEIVVLTDGFSAMWDLLQAVVSAFDPNQANDAQLDGVCALTGTTREPQTFSSASVTCTGTPNTVLIVGRVVKTSDTGSRFASTEQKTITALTAWAALTAYVVGDRRTNANRCYRCITAGTSAASGGPTTTAADITDAGAHWKYLGEGTGAVDVDFDGEVAGPVGALAGFLSVIATPVDGWSNAVNLLDASIGALRESNPDLRARRELELAGQGGSTADAIRAKVRKVNEGSTDSTHQPPSTVTVFFNDTDNTNSDGLPPHSVEVLVQDGTDADIALAVWNSVGAGTATFGNQTSVVVDSEGNSQTVKWSRPVEVPIYVTTTVYYDAAAWPATGADALVVQAALSAILTYGDAISIGFDVRALQVGGAVVRGPSATSTAGLAVVPAPAGSVAAPGILDVSPIFIGTAPSPGSSSTIAISRRQIAVFDSSRCVITATSAVP